MFNFIPRPSGQSLMKFHSGSTKLNYILILFRSIYETSAFPLSSCTISKTFLKLIELDEKKKKGKLKIECRKERNHEIFSSNMASLSGEKEKSSLKRSILPRQRQRWNFITYSSWYESQRASEAQLWLNYIIVHTGNVLDKKA